MLAFNNRLIRAFFLPASIVDALRIMLAFSEPKQMLKRCHYTGLPTDSIKTRWCKWTGVLPSRPAPRMLTHKPGPLFSLSPIVFFPLSRSLLVYSTDTHVLLIAHSRKVGSKLEITLPPEPPCTHSRAALVGLPVCEAEVLEDVRLGLGRQGDGWVVDHLQAFAAKLHPALHLRPLPAKCV